MKKITLQSVGDEAIGALGASAGVIGGSLLMKLANGKVNPWLVPLIGFVAGYGIRLISDNETLKDVGTGLLIAGTMDGTKKVLSKFSAQVPMLATINESIPALSGINDTEFSNFRINNLGAVADNLRGDYSPANVVSSSMLRG